MADEHEINKLRYRAGLVVFAVSFLSPLLIPLVALSGASTGLKAILSGLLAVGIPELGMVAAVAILGKSGYREILKRIAGFMRAHGPLDEVSPVRYRIGLVMFVVPVIFAVAQPYAEFVLSDTSAHDIWVTIRLPVAVIGDVLFLSSFVVLGGNFWDKIRALFIRSATASFSGPEADRTG